MTGGRVGVLAQACRDFAEARDQQEVLNATVRLTRMVVGADASLRIALATPAGDLRTVVSQGEAFPAVRRRPAHRRGAAGNGSPIQVQLPLNAGASSQDLTLLVCPLAVRDSSIGLLEVVMPRPQADRSRQVVEAIATLAGGALRSVTEREKLERRLAAVARPMSLAHTILGQRSPRSAVRAAGKLLFEQVGMPVAAWYGSDKESLELVLLRTPACANERRAPGDLARLTRPATLRRPDGSGAVDRFRELTGGSRISVIQAEDALILVGGDGGAWRGPLTHLLQEVLRLFNRKASEQERAEQLQLGLAATAHELRNPLLGARAAIEAALDANPEQERGLLDRSRRQLEELAELVDQLLQWSVGRYALRRAPRLLAPIVLDAATSPPLDAESHRLELTASSDVVVNADEPQLRLALSNVIRNAFAYSPPDAPVLVAVGGRLGKASIRVTDRGPGIRPDELETIFDPVVRGSAGTAGRRGHGLGLFIARKVIEAHDGTISVEMAEKGTSFRVTLPAVSGL